MQAAEAAKEEAEQRFWLPLERSKGRQMGELCVSLLLTKVGLVIVVCVDKHDSNAHCSVQSVLVYNRAWPVLCTIRLMRHTSYCRHDALLASCNIRHKNSLKCRLSSSQINIVPLR